MQQTQIQSPFKLSDVERVWPRVMAHIQNAMPAEQFDTWIQGAQPIGYDHNVCMISVRNAYVHNWLTSRMAGTFGEFISNELNDLVRGDDFKSIKVTAKFQIDPQDQVDEVKRTDSTQD